MLVDGRVVACDGSEGSASFSARVVSMRGWTATMTVSRLTWFSGGDPMGHPRVYINLDDSRPDDPSVCGNSSCLCLWVLSLHFV